MPKKGFQNHLVVVFGIFGLLILTLVVSVLLGEVIWLKIAVGLGIGLLTFIMVSWFRRLTSKDGQ